MEKSFWIFIKPEVWEKVSNGDESVFVGLYFEYPSLTGSNGYGSTSEYIKNNEDFVHKEMWLDYPTPKF
jgi:hypothetical protein